MAEKLSRDEWKGEIRKAASDAADAYVKWVKSNSAAAPAPGLKEKVMGDMESFLSKKYPYDSITNDDMETMVNFPSDDLWKWQVHGDSYDPRRKHEAEELAKFMPFLQGVAPEGESWLDNRHDMKLKAAELGFDYSQEGLGKFLDKLAKYQGVYDRAQIMKELRSKPWYWPTRIAYPSMMEGVENAISTGSDFSGKQMAGLMGTDAVTNVAMFGAPGTAARVLGTSPIMSGVIDAGLQGALELQRQGIKARIDPTLESDPAQAIAAMTFGATRPGLIGTTQAAVAKIPGKGAFDFSRGIGKATRAGNPASAERDAVEELVKAHNKVIEDNYARLGTAGATPVLDDAGKMVGTLPKSGKLADVSVADTERMLGAGRVPEMAKLLGVKAKPSGRYDVDEFMKAYDRKPVYTWDITHNTAKVTTPVEGYKSAKELFQLTPENSGLYKSYFPQKYADEAGASRARSAGLVIGNLLGDFGGRFEPTFKLNPLNIGPQTTKKYNEQDWYTRLGPKARAIIDEAFKKKLEEEEEKADLDATMGL
jgi:hypothetical protein